VGARKCRSIRLSAHDDVDRAREKTVTGAEAIPMAAPPMTWTRALVLRLLWSGWAVSVSVVLLATIAVEAVPHARGIGFFPSLRYAVITPACILIAVAAAFLYRIFTERFARPRRTHRPCSRGTPSRTRAPRHPGEHMGMAYEQGRSAQRLVGHRRRSAR
jgi:hypothetical protein